MLRRFMSLFHPIWPHGFVAETLFGPPDSCCLWPLYVADHNGVRLCNHTLFLSCTYATVLTEMVSIFRKRSQATEQIIGTPDEGARSMPRESLAGSSHQDLGLSEDLAHDASDNQVNLSDPNGSESFRHVGPSDRLEKTMPAVETASHPDVPSIENPQAAQRRFESSQRLVQEEEELPKFRSGPPDLASRTSSAAAPTDVVAHTELWETFTPTRPKELGRFFAGRRWAVQRMITAIEEDQAHIIIYGPRGIGKTSLANVLAESANQVECQILRYPCNTNTTFEGLFRSFLKNLPSEYMNRSTQAKYSGVNNFEQILPPGEFGPADLTETLCQLKQDHAILIIDEFDRVESDQLKNRIAETIKNLSDTSARVTFVIVGIARSLEELIGMHPSIQRHLVGIHLPLMEPSELQRMLLSGEQATGIRFDDVTRDMIVSFSKGLPYYAQLLALHTGRMALECGSSTADVTHLRGALEIILNEADPLVKTAYEIATRDETNLFAVDVLYAAALAKFDKYGSFTAADTAKIIIDDDGRQIPKLTLHKAFNYLSQQKNAEIIDKWKTPAARTRYTFNLQTMRQYILLRQAARRGLM